MIKQNLYQLIVVLVCFICLCSSALFWKKVDSELQDLRQIKNTESTESVSIQDFSSPNQQIVTHSQLWRPVQDKVRDTVVQIFSQVAAIDLLQPFKTPSQGAAYGSGFFINEEGEIITNAHVIDQAKSVWIQIPSLGKRIIDVEIVGINPDRDLALLQVTAKGKEQIIKELGKIPYLPLGNSDLIRRADEVMALGYPLGQQALKSTTGVVSGREQNFIQTSAPLNPGNSGGPLVNNSGEVIGINSAGILEAQNVGYAIPINDLKIILADMHKVKILRKPFLGVLFNNATDSLVEYLGNPHPGGCYVAEVVKNSTLDKAGVKSGDMIYKINGHSIDIFGEMRVPWSEDKISIIDFVSHLTLGQNLNLEVYRSGVKKNIKATFSMAALPSVREVYPGFEEVDYEVFAGMVVMPLSLNHLPLLANRAPGLAKYTEARHQSEPVLVVSHIFPNSQLYRSRSFHIGSTINEINGIKVSTLEDFRKALKASTKTNFLTIKVSDNLSRKSDNLLVALPWSEIIQEETKLAHDFKYQMTPAAKELLQLSKVHIMLDPKQVQG